MTRKGRPANAKKDAQSAEHSDWTPLIGFTSAQQGHATSSVPCHALLYPLFGCIAYIRFISSCMLYVLYPFASQAHRGQTRIHSYFLNVTFISTVLGILDDTQLHFF